MTWVTKQEAEMLDRRMDVAGGVRALFVENEASVLVTSLVFAAFVAEQASFKRYHSGPEALGRCMARSVARGSGKGK